MPAHSYGLALPVTELGKDSPDADAVAQAKDCRQVRA
jgi:hypothetical protein